MAQASPIVQWVHSVTDGIQNNKFLDYSVNTGYFGIPMATFGLVTIAIATFIHVTFTDELQQVGEQVGDQVNYMAQKATDLAASAQERLTEEASRLSERVGGGGKRRLEKRHKTYRGKHAYYYGKTRKETKA